MADIDPFAAAVITAYCGWDPTEYVEQATVLLDGNDAPVLALPCMHVTDVSSVRLLGVGLLTLGFGNDVVWLENGCLVWRRGLRGGQYFLPAWPAGDRNVEVTYSGGYEDVPADLAAVADTLAERLGSPLLGAKRVVLDTAEVWRDTFGGDLTPMEQLVLDRYRLPSRL